MCILFCLGCLQSVRDRQFGLIFNQLKVRESMYWCHPKSNHNSFGYIPDQQEERKRKRTHYKEEKNLFKVDEIKMSVSDKIMVCLGRLPNLMKKLINPSKHFFKTRNVPRSAGPFLGHAHFDSQFKVQCSTFIVHF